ncbi:hypothetical protein SARC_01543 [Sphaeroforma arctica JP610]|uniref:Dihydrolipoamide acetyltransferase component of pyruvate dehydrogenase complex n=1 Tax=Sphaeroforma arctica JP610 TaxID=667725 RepID=A0A0L0GBK9_9EUKA|nr:hypothetical protein SARC_01543 [Sphaeroforma arctica JP610]KNC86281.1 hypothetical protein SARC_01543 [Sphaeroforma arctica JP610]|eukprot:XP_014160183.1 hypothetical protein SARC_01543 [Sphaeroforma arctica JP610]
MMQSVLLGVRRGANAYRSIPSTQQSQWRGAVGMGVVYTREYVTKVVMPALSPTMTEGVISKWCIEEGESIEAGDVLFEMETDKATMEVESNNDGILAKILVPASTDVKTPVNKNVALMVEEGEDWKNVEIPADDDAGASSEAPAEKASESAEAPAPAQSSGGGDDDSHAATRSTLLPSVAQLVQKHNLNVAEIPATGPKGHLLKGDVLNFLETGQKVGAQSSSGSSQAAPSTASKSAPAKSAAPAADAEYEDLPVSNMRKIIGSRLLESKTTIPHTYMTLECDLTNVAKMRANLKEQGVKVSVNDFVVKACAAAISEVPGVNCQLQKDGAIKENDSIGISVAVATPTGLITPIVTQANGRSVRSISGAIKELAGRAKAGKLQPKEYQGGSFSVSNLGMFGVAEFAAVINPPQAAIMAVGGGRKVFKAGEAVDGIPTYVPAELMTCRLSYDERVIDSETMAKFCDQFTANMEDPLNMI